MKAKVIVKVEGNFNKKDLEWLEEEISNLLHHGAVENCSGYSTEIEIEES
uniref:Uncharacterized protein n=1 Tax=viral metagenome TaxID=1070528 RepID=A0A6M3IM72_9ZZZZ